MDQERREELNDAVNEVARFNLWRRGRTNCYTGRKNVQKVLGESLEIVCGGVLDYLELQKDFDQVLQEKIEWQKRSESKEKLCVEIIKERDALKAERNYFKGLLATFRIPHKRKKKR